MTSYYNSIHHICCDFLWRNNTNIEYRWCNCNKSSYKFWRQHISSNIKHNIYMYISHIDLLYRSICVQTRYGRCLRYCSHARRREERTKCWMNCLPRRWSLNPSAKKGTRVLGLILTYCSKHLTQLRKERRIREVCDREREREREKERGMEREWEQEWTLSAWHLTYQRHLKCIFL